MGRVLCVAEKPKIARAVAQHLGGTIRTANVRDHQWVKNYEFDYHFQPWGPCNVKFTSVMGHLMSYDFPEQYKRWESCDPGELFSARINRFVDQVRLLP